MTKRARSLSGSGESIDFSALSSRPIVIERVSPDLDDGRFAVKRGAGDRLQVEATIFAEEGSVLAAVLKVRPVGAGDDGHNAGHGDSVWEETPMVCVDADQALWRASVRLEDMGRYEYTLEAWRDPWASWVHDIKARRAAGWDVSRTLAEGRELVLRAMARARGDDEKYLSTVLRSIDVDRRPEAQIPLMLSAELAVVMERWPDRPAVVCYDRVLPLIVEHPRSRFAAWYEMDPRAQSAEPGRRGTFEDCLRRLPEVRAMGFDVLYLAPIHPAATPAGTVEPAPKETGGREMGGGLTAIDPGLGTLDDLHRLVRAANHLGMEVALDIAIQCAADHPWVTDHPEWFRFPPDGPASPTAVSSAMAQDVVPLDFFGPHRDELWLTLRDVFEFWIGHGVTVFCVGTPQTTPVSFWEWVIRDVKHRHPYVQFLAEACPHPPMMKMLAKVGFTQSFSAFPWRNGKQDLTDYMTELTQTKCVECMLPNLFTNTSDILPEYLRQGARPAFVIRAVLAATLSTVYGIYNGFELCEAGADPGLNPVKTTGGSDPVMVWDWDLPGHIKEPIAKLNHIRLENPALQRFNTLRFYSCDHDDVLFYGKMTRDRTNIIMVACTTNPVEAAHVWMEFPLEEMGLREDQPFEVEELISGDRHAWSGRWHHYYLDPTCNPAVIFRVSPGRSGDGRSSS